MSVARVIAKRFGDKEKEKLKFILEAHEFCQELKKAAFEEEAAKTEDEAWYPVYNAVFSEEISRKVFSMIDLDYYDPDMSYKADSVAFIDALAAYVDLHKAQSSED